MDDASESEAANRTLLRAYCDSAICRLLMPIIIGEIAILKPDPEAYITHLVEFIQGGIDNIPWMPSTANEMMTDTMRSIQEQAMKSQRIKAG